MSSTKNRDLAKELVDFLLKKEDGKAQGDDKNSKSTAKPPVEFGIQLGSDDDPEANFNKQDKKNRKIIEGAELPPIPGTDPTIEPREVSIISPIRKEEKPIEVIEKFYEKPQPPPSARAVPEPTPPARVQPGDTASEPSSRAQAIYNDVSKLVGGSEAVRVAQARISQLEKERDQLRDETEKLLSTSEALQRRVNELKAAQENTDRKHREKVEILEEEKLVIKNRLTARESELADLKKQHEEFQARFQNDLRKVRVRERELENRQELLKAETTAVIRSKDELILELKRQLEQLSFELDNFRGQSADLNARLTEFHERNHRTVKALRLALNVLELGDSEDQSKKASGT